MTNKIEPSAASKTAALLANLWERNLPMLKDRLGLLDRATACAVSQTLGRDLREEAAATAHKLAGSLGMFGHTEGTRVAREIEQMLGAPGDIIDSQLLTRLSLKLRHSLPL